MGYLTHLSASCKEIVVGFISPIYSLLQMEIGMRLTLAPRSHKALLIVTSPTEQGMEKLPGSESLEGSEFWIRALHSLVRDTVAF